MDLKKENEKRILELSTSLCMSRAHTVVCDLLRIALGTSDEEALAYLKEEGLSKAMGLIKTLHYLDMREEAIATEILIESCRNS